jgi:DNA-binding NarL/FixJ family response regulator
VALFGSVSPRNDLNCGTWDDGANNNLTVRVGLDIVKGAKLETSSSRVLVVEDSEPFRKFVCSTLGKKPEFQIVGEAIDGLEAVQRAEKLRPDVIVLDIGLPSIHGIEAARRILRSSPKSKIVFVSQESSADVVREALGTGARGYIVKTDAGSELLEALDVVLRGGHFVGRRFSGHDFVSDSQEAASQDMQSNRCTQLDQNMEIARRHDVGFYSNDARLLDDLTHFIGVFLKAGNAAIVVATEAHRGSLLLRLQANGLDIGAAIEQGRYITLDAAETLSTFMRNGMPDSVLFSKLLGNLIVTAGEAVKKEQARVAIFGECVHLLWEQGNAEAAIQVEQLGNRLAERYNVNILCGYSVDAVQGVMDSHIFQQICAEHSAVHSR